MCPLQHPQSILSCEPCTTTPSLSLPARQVCQNSPLLANPRKHRLHPGCAHPAPCFTPRCQPQGGCPTRHPPMVPKDQGTPTKPRHDLGSSSLLHVPIYCTLPVCCPSSTPQWFIGNLVMLVNNSPRGGGLIPIYSAVQGIKIKNPVVTSVMFPLLAPLLIGYIMKPFLGY